MKIEQHNKSAKNLVIPTGTTNIDDGAFRNYVELGGVVIPDGVREIGICAFAGCKNLKTITFPKSIKLIWAGAFDDVNNLREINYAGSKEEWASFVKETGLDITVDSCVVKCADGEIVLEGRIYCPKEVTEEELSEEEIAELEWEAAMEDYDLAFKPVSKG